jgi:hypothetical protein
MITSLPERIAALPPELRARCERIFFVDRVVGSAVVPPPMARWVAERFGAVEAVERQTIVRVVNRLTLEATLFNPLRALRPAGEVTGDDEIAAWLTNELAGRDFFADPLRETTADLFGRIEGRFCVSASNVAKYDGWHGVIVFAEPHPLRFGHEQLEDYLDVALRWLAAAHECDPLAVYPMITWNCMPKSGASIAHGHMQVALGRGMHYARPEGWRRAAEAYESSTGEDYFAALNDVHLGLGLGLAARSAVRVFAHLTPLRGREVVMLAEAPSEHERRSLAPLLAGVLAPTLRVMIEHQGVRAFNLGVSLPPFGATAESWRGVPVVARVADRGSALTYRNDWGAMELFANGCVTADPFVVAEELRSSAMRA